MNRREFLGTVSGAAVAAAGLHGAETPVAAVAGAVMTVRGPRRAGDLGMVLPHEHVLVDFNAPTSATGPRYDPAVAFAKIKPFLDEARALGCATLIECTPAYLGRDPALLVRLSEATGLHLITNTGWYAARQGRFLPEPAARESADEIAERWVREWRFGIDGTAVRPGFIKLGFDAGALDPMKEKLVRAAARTHRVTGLTIAAHTGDDVAALAQLELLRAEGLDPSAWIWVHAQNARDDGTLETLARAGAWLSFDGVSPRSLTRHVERVTQMKKLGFLGRVLVSHDAGWYRPGEPDGGAYRGYDVLFRGFLPALRQAGFTDDDVRTLTVVNPARAFTMRPRIA